MTLIIGIKCSDGIVLGADGAATYGTLGTRTISQATPQKLSVLCGCLVVGVSGPVGLGQRFGGEISHAWQSRELNKAREAHEMMVLLSERLRKHIMPEFAAAQAAVPLLGAQIAGQSALSSSVVALPVGNNPELFQFDQQGSPERATKELPFVAIGSGQATADPFLAFLRRVFWPNSLPSLADGIFATLWTLKHAIETSPGGVSDPKQIVVLRKSDKKVIAEELSTDDLDEHFQAIEASERALSEVRTIGDAGEGGGAEPPPIPRPPGSHS